MLSIKVQLYTKSDCPLCDAAKSVLQELGQEFPVEVEEIDITTNIGMFNKYKTLIPVLKLDGKCLFVHRIDAAALKRKLVWTSLRKRLAGN